MMLDPARRVLGLRFVTEEDLGQWGREDLEHTRHCLPACDPSISGSGYPKDCRLCEGGCLCVCVCLSE